MKSDLSSASGPVAEKASRVSMTARDTSFYMRIIDHSSVVDARSHSLEWMLSIDIVSPFYFCMKIRHLMIP